MQSLLCYYNAVVQEKFCFRLSGASFFLSHFASGSFPPTLFFAHFKTQQPSLFDSQPPHQKHSSRKGKQEVAHSRPTPCDDDIFQHCPPHPQLQTLQTHPALTAGQRALTSSASAARPDLRRLKNTRQHHLSRCPPTPLNPGAELAKKHREQEEKRREERQECDAHPSLRRRRASWGRPDENSRT